ncbi:hypothetical protein Voc01_070270 [Virgisporangium ochraceum]|uniref:Uncharacterized protein n=2 Tax=Virgisporangium ochraceum TaxID=65505 RepID=A0A8J4A2D3_9ACTN|nr:hypothetical protein Voc01_070270 [Virgisporangium ochraceum]
MNGAIAGRDATMGPMRIALASTPGSAATPNEDWAGASAWGVAVVLDGLTEADGTGCEHGTPWYVRELGGQLMRLAARPDGSLTEALGGAIALVRDSHGPGCDLTHAGSPGATAAVARWRDAAVEYLVLSDAYVVVDAGTEPAVLTDASMPDRVDGAAPHDTDGFAAVIRERQRLRNRPGGYWVAQSDPSAATQALTGVVADATSVVLLSDGAAALATSLGALSWRELVDLAVTRGPAELIAATREVEARDPHGRVWPRFKVHDDASAVVLHRTTGATARGR